MAEKPLGGGEVSRGHTAYGYGYEGRPGLLDRVRWGPILAGVFVTLSSAIVLTLLGLAVQAAVGDPTAATGEAAGWGWTIWGVIVLIVSFGAGGWIAGQSAALKSQGAGLLNGAMVWAVAVPVIFFMLPMMFGALSGPAAMVVQATDQPVEQVYAMPRDGEPAQAGQPQEANAQETLNIAAWGSLIALLLGLGAAAGGGMFAGKAEEPPHDRGDRGDRDRGGPYSNDPYGERNPRAGGGTTGTTTTTPHTPPPSEP